MPRKPHASSSPPVDAEREPNEEASGPRAFWSGTVSFGLVSIPVELFSATRTTRQSLRMLAPSGTPVVRRYFGEGNEPLDSDALAHGYEVEKEEFVPITEEELAALAPEQSRDIDLSQFVARDSIPPLLFERAYILAPSGKSNVAYRLLADTLERAGKVGIGTFVMRGKQHLVAIVGDDGLLRAETLRYVDQIRSPGALDLPEAREPSAAEVKRMRKAIESHAKTSVPEKELEDTYWSRLSALVEKKRKAGQDVIAVETPEEEEGAEVIDLVEILKDSLARKGARGAHAEKARKPRTRASVSKTPSRKASARATTMTTKAKAKTRKPSVRAAASGTKKAASHRRSA